ncbi:MAG: hydrogenase 4 subunit B [Thermomicrobiales bacterium]|nr:MAG: hydrogenase 4 subunit B [Thermomicrobiales bacterium]
MTDTSSLSSGLLPLPIAWYGLAASVVLVRASSGKPPLQRLPAALTMVGGGSGAGIALWTLFSGHTTLANGWALAPFAHIGFRLDPLAAFFLLAISIAAIAAAWYSVGYLAPHAPHGHHQTNRASVDALLATFLGSMSLLVLADGIAGFLAFWELMSLVSFFLVIGDGRSLRHRRSAFVYAVMTHVGTGALVIALLLLARHAGSFQFSAIATSSGTLGQAERSIIFLLALVGFGTKAGLIPLHIWLPRAHPAAPSHVSAVMSGVMVKTALYGLLRLVLELAGPPAPWWGSVLVLAGAASAVLGILYALMERDLKRILAYSTVEHVGILTMGIGATVQLAGSGHPQLAALPLVATLVHLLNHSLFKGLLFLGAGAVQTGCGLSDLERLGGLIRRMPRTAALMLAGCAAISAVPPLNGFAGEWLLFRGFLNLGTASTHVRAGVLAATAAAALALTGALAIACFVRMFGVGFLAQPQSQRAQDAHEVPGTMIGAMGLLATGCIVLGLAPGLALRLLRPVSQQLLGNIVQSPVGLRQAFATSQGDSAYLPIMVAAGFLAIGLVPWLIARVIGGPVRQRRAPTWVCGVRLEPGMQYSATAFAKPIRLIFQAVIRPQRTIHLERPASQYVVSTIRYDEWLTAVYERHLYERVTRWLVSASHRARQVQSGSLRTYLTYMFITLVLALLVAR